MDLTTHNHINQTNGGVTLDAAKFALATEGDEDCETMAAREEAARTDPDSPPEVCKPKTTHSVGNYKPPPPDTNSYNMIACSKAVDFVGNPAYSEGVGKSETKTYKRDKMKEPKPAERDSNLCDGYQHKSPNNCAKSSHTEARMIEEIFKNVKPNKAGSLGKLNYKSIGMMGQMKAPINLVVYVRNLSVQLKIVDLKLKSVMVENQKNRKDVMSILRNEKLFGQKK